MKPKIVFAGFRHGHIFALHKRVMESGLAEITGAAEENEDARNAAMRNGVRFTHETNDTLIRESGCDIVAVGDCYGRRGALVLAALRSGKHVISDKPLCTNLEELNEIEMESRNRNLCIGCMFDLRTSPNMRTARRVLRSGMIGEIQSVQFNGQHPLNYGTRPDWYFIPDMHGGTINDIAIHAFDAIPYMTGLGIKHTFAARCFNVAFPEKPHFQNGAQLMLELENGAGVIGDISYAAPSFSVPGYWRFTIAGTGGLIEFNQADTGICLWEKGSVRMKRIEPDSEVPDYFECFLNDLQGKTADLTTGCILAATRLALNAQALADQSNENSYFRR